MRFIFNIKNWLLILMVLFNSYALTQTSTFELCISSYLDDIPWDAVELNDSSYIILTQKNWGSPLYLDCDIYLYRVSWNGSILDSLVYSPNKAYRLAVTRKILKYTDTSYLVVGNCYDRSTSDSQLYLSWVSENLVFMRDTIIGDNNQAAYYGDYLLNSEGNLLCAGYYYDTIYHSLIMEYYFEGDTIIKNSFTNFNPAHLITEVTSEGTYHIYGMLGGDSLVIADKTTLEIIDKKHFPEPYFPVSIANIPGSSDYFVGGRSYNLNDFTHKISYRLMDSAGDILDQRQYGVLDTNYFFAINELDCNDSDFFFLGGTHNVTSELPYLYPERRWIFINKINIDGSVIWQNFYKGSLNYSPYKILSTKDGGALILSHKYDWNSSYPNQRDIHILKVDSNGYYSGMTSIDEITGMPLQILVYPNPANSSFNIASGNYFNLEFAIYDLKGHLFLQKELIGSHHNINIESLPPDLYIYKVWDDNGFTESGKLIVR